MIIQQSTDIYLSSVSEPELSSQISSQEENAAEDDKQSRSRSSTSSSCSSSSSSSFSGSEGGSKEDIDKPHMTKMSISWIWSRTFRIPEDIDNEARKEIKWRIQR